MSEDLNRHLSRPAVPVDRHRDLVARLVAVEQRRELTQILHRFTVDGLHDVAENQLPVCRSDGSSKASPFGARSRIDGDDHDAPNPQASVHVGVEVFVTANPELWRGVLATLDDLRDDAAYCVYRHGKPDAGRCAGRTIDGRVDTDQTTQRCRATVRRNCLD